MLNPDDDEILYTSSPAMFRSRPILFMLAVASIAIGIGLIVLPLWWWRCRSVRITVTRQKTILRKGIFSLYLNEVQHVNVRNVQLRQTFFQRIMNVGTIGISSSGQAGIEIEVDGIPDPMRVKRLIESGGKQSGVVSATRRVVEQTSSPAVANEAYPFRSRRESNSVEDGHRQNTGHTAKVIAYEDAVVVAGDRQNTGHTKLIWVTLALLGTILSAFLAAKAMPWIMVLVSLALGGAGIAFLAVPAVRMMVQLRIPSFVGHPQSNLLTGGVVGYCVLLFCFSVTAIRENWRIQAEEKKVAGMIHDAEAALGFGELDAANDIVGQLDTDRRASGSPRFKELKSQVNSALKIKALKRANERVLQLVIAANQLFVAQRYGDVERSLNEAFGIQGATDLEEVHRLANKLLDEKVKAATKLIEANDLNGATTLAIEAEKLPGVTNKSGLTELLTKIANLSVAAKAAVANDHFQAERLGDAERELTAAISIKNATELAEARTLLNKVASERKRIGDLRVASEDRVPTVTKPTPPEAKPESTAIFKRDTPETVGRYLKERGLGTRRYKEQFDGAVEYAAVSDYKGIGVDGKLVDDNGVMQNNMTYFIEGNKKSVKRLTLSAHVNNQAGRKQATSELLAAALVLAEKATGQPCPHEARKAIEAAKSGAWNRGDVTFKVIRDDFTGTGKGYSLRFQIE